MTLTTAIITLILVMDPLGNIPTFLSILKRIDPKRRRRIILREALIALLILTIFLFFGEYILKEMQISQPALGIAGGIILFIIALRMIFPHEDHESPDKKSAGEPFVVPLAIPLVAGPSTIAFVMLIASQAPEHRWLWMLALLLAWIPCTILLVFADFLRKILGEQGLTAIERLMGMILTTMAVQMFLSGIEKFYHL